MDNEKCCVGQAVRAEGTAAEEIINQLTRAATQCDQAVSRAQDKLGPLCKPMSPEMLKPNNNTPQARREFPPYFENIRGLLDEIEAATTRLNNTLNRLDV